MTTEEYPSHGADRLALLYRISQTFNSSLDLDMVLNLVMDEVIKSTRAERGFLMLTTADQEMVFQAARGIDSQSIDQPQSQVSRSVIDRVAREGRPILTSNAQDDDWLSERKSVMVLGLRSVLCVPLQHKGQSIGVIYVDNRIQAGIFTTDDLDLLTAIASNAAVAIENARLYRLAVEKGRLERELQLAREVQTSMLPSVLPEIPDWDFSARWRPAREVAGDYYDFIETTGPGVTIVIADVSDKGMPAALYMSLTRSIVRSCMVSASQPADIIRQANRLISSDNAFGMFVTLFFVKLNPQTGEFTYVNAGHNPPLYYNARNRTLTPLTRTGMAIGVDSETPYFQSSITILPGDFVLAYTDGVTEAIDSKKQEYGTGRLMDLLLQSGNLTASEIVDRLQQSVHEFQAGEPSMDDITVVVIRREE